MSFSTLRNHSVIQELSSNKRLQWLLIIIVGMLCASGLKALSDKNSEIVTEIATQQRLLARLKTAAKMELSEQQVQDKAKQASAVLANVPSAPSISVAEANALSRIETIATNVQRGRSSLVGTETLAENMSSSNSPTLWQVRVEFQGQLNQHSFSTLLNEIDGSDPTVRVVSFRYRPGERGTFAVVLDFMFKQQAK